MTFRLLVLDFDGTFTDAHAEAETYASHYRAAVTELFGRDISEEWEGLRSELLRDPSRHGWSYGGHFAAPCAADPYLRVSCVAQRLFDRHGMLTDPDARAGVLESLYRDSYAQTPSVPRPEASHVLDQVLQRDLHVAVVTNSPAEVVARKLASLSVPGSERVQLVGDARKFVIDSSPRGTELDALADLALPGLEGRQVLVRRSHYFAHLCALWQQSGAARSETLVVGDIFELDLALPLCLGAHVHLVHHRETPDYEVRFVASHARGATSSDLSGVLQRL